MVDVLVGYPNIDTVADDVSFVNTIIDCLIEAESPGFCTKKVNIGLGCL